MKRKKPDTLEEYESTIKQEQEDHDRAKERYENAVKDLTDALHIDRILTFLNSHVCIVVLAGTAFVCWFLYLIVTNW